MSEKVEKVKELNIQSITKVGFQAFRRVEGDSTPKSKIHYEDITVNEGKGFDGTTFKAPINGVYKFAFTGNSSLEKGKRGSVGIQKNGTAKFCIFDLYEGENCKPMTGSVNLVLAAGDEVTTVSWLPIHTGKGFEACFSGRLLFKNDLISKWIHFHRLL